MAPLLAMVPLLAVASLLAMILFLPISSLLDTASLFDSVSLLAMSPVLDHGHRRDSTMGMRCDFVQLQDLQTPSPTMAHSLDVYLLNHLQWDQPA